MRDIYELSEDVSGKYSVPVLFDKKTNRIINNESSEIIRILNNAFDIPSIDLYPERLRSIIDETNAWIYPQLNNGVYRCGFAQSQEAYDTAIIEVLTALERLEGILARQRYLCSNDQITEADIRLYPTLVRYDEVYIVYFKASYVYFCNRCISFAILKILSQ